ncbi:MAG: DUF5004 domain-containing protein [Bacteroidales bacterium]|nr:DUF5004 domain-containing protein [Bacteroidales bacterium]
MRKLFAKILVFVLLFSAFVSCYRYENGPAFSLKSPLARISGEWMLNDLIVNDKRDDVLFERENPTKFTINRDGTYTYEVVTMAKTPGDFEGFWEFDENKTMLKLIVVDTVRGNSSRDYKITRLSDDEVWLIDKSDEYSGIDVFIERRFVKNK